MRSCCILEGITPNHLWWNVMEENMRKRIYIYLGHFAVQEKFTEHCNSTVIKNKSFKKIILAILGLPCFHPNFGIISSISVKNCHWSYDRDCIDSVDCLAVCHCSMVILTVLILIHERTASFHLCHHQFHLFN